MCIEEWADHLDDVTIVFVPALEIKALDSTEKKCTFILIFLYIDVNIKYAKLFQIYTWKLTLFWLICFVPFSFCFLDKVFWIFKPVKQNRLYNAYWKNGTKVLKITSH